MRHLFPSAFSLAIAIMIAAAAAGAQGPENPSPSTSRTVWDGVYNLAQASRGETSYTTHCASCHRDDLTGYDGLLRGTRFMDKYREASLHLLFDKTRSTMPRNSAASLSDQTYVDILSYVLKVNEFPAGENELEIDDVASVRLVGKGGPEPVPNFSLVLVVGCLTRSGDEWVMINTREPVRTALPQPAAGELPAMMTVKTPPVSGATFRLMASAAYAPSRHADQVVEARGFLIRRSDGDRINVTSITTVGPACGP